jgi:transcriptional regulator with XRE-family HTH domain
MDPFELKLLRIRRGLRQYQVAAKVGIAPCRLSEIETGRREPSPELLERIIRAIEVKDSVQSAQPRG